MAGWSVFLLAFGGALAVVAVRATRGEGSPGEAILVVQLAAQIRGQVNTAAYTIQDVMKAFITMDRLGWLRNYEAATAPPPASEAAQMPDALRQGLQLEGVTFRYPGTEVDVLRGINLDLPAGSSVAIVGDNGAGKTTLIKLLCGFYRPTEGRITVDDVPLDAFDMGAWRRGVSGAFQDFVRLEAGAPRIRGRRSARTRGHRRGGPRCPRTRCGVGLGDGVARGPRRPRRQDIQRRR